MACDRFRSRLWVAPDEAVMKVVLFCGGLGTRLRAYSEDIPKPLVPLGSIPILSHVIKYYVHHGHSDFLLCLGYKADVIKKYFMESRERVAVDIVEPGVERVTLATEVGVCRVAFADTGLAANVGQRLKAVQALLKDEPVFLANYADGLSDFPLPRLFEELERRHAVGIFLSVRPNASFHFVRRGADGRVLSVDDVLKADAWINGGFFVFTKEIFDYLRPGEELVEQPFGRLIEEGRLFTIEYDGFWRCVDTFKDLQALENLLSTGDAPWMVWRGSPSPASPRRPGPAD
jgi:glucose-1-phosphate cytidylyltransferase